MQRYLIFSTDPVDNLNERHLGGKGWNLFRLAKFGFSVPRWCVVSSTLFDAAMTLLRDTIEKTIHAIDFTDRKSIERGSQDIRSFIVDSGMPDEARQQLGESLVRFFGTDLFLSVRSSVVGEDSVMHSFAGQMDSYLNVQADAVLEVVVRVWASSFSSRALAYRHRKKISLTDISAAAIVQEMVQSEASGVAFTRDPESLAKQCVISAGFGLGEGVVGDMVETDTYSISRDLREIAKKVPVKDRRVVRDEAEGTRMEALPEDIRGRQVLTDEQILEVGVAAAEAEDCFGTPQDLEWAFDGQGKLYLLQARPIVILPQRGRIRIWDNSNIIEGYPGITLPLTFSFIRNGYENIFRNASLSFLLTMSDIRDDLHIFKNMVGLLDGRVYYGLLNWYRMMSYLPGYRKYKEAWDEMIGISGELEFPKSNLSPVNRIYSFLMVIWRLLTTKRNEKKFYEFFTPAYNKVSNIELSGCNEDDIIEIYDGLERDCINKWHLTLFNDFCAIRYYDWLKKLCTLWISHEPNIYNDLLCGEHGMQSVAPVNSLISIAERISSETELRELLSEKDDEAVWDRIQRDNTYGALREMLEGHLRAYGDRCVEELKLEKPSFRDNPAALITIIRNYYQLGLSLETVKTNKYEIRKRAEKKVSRVLKNPLKKLLFIFVLNNARFAISSRENMRFERSRLYGVVRRLFARMGELLTEKEILQSISDIYYLTVEEVFGLVDGKAVTKNLRGIVSVRRKEYEELSQLTPKRQIRTTGIPYLNSLYDIETTASGGKELKGTGCSSGTAKGIAKVIYDPTSVVEGDNFILVAKSTDPGWVFLMISSQGIIVERGSVLSHTAIIGREFGIPTIVGVKDATSLILDGAKINIDGSTGLVQWQ